MNEVTGGNRGHRAIIPPVPSEEPRPLWSVMIPTHNCARFLGNALQSVLSQVSSTERMQIEVVDDASDDDPGSVVDRLGNGRVTFHRQVENLGLHGNLADCLRRARGRYVHLLHGDDCVLPGFYEAMEQGFGNPDVGAAFCRWRIIDDNGIEIERAPQLTVVSGPLSDALAVVASEQRIVTPSIAVRRSVWEEVGGFDARLSSAEDWETWVRIASRHKVHYDPRMLASYRVHGASATARALTDAREMRDTRRAMDLFAPLLPPGQRATILHEAGKAYAARCIERGREMNAAGRHADASSHAALALRFSLGPRTLKAALAIWLRLA